MHASGIKQRFRRRPKYVRVKPGESRAASKRSGRLLAACLVAASALIIGCAAVFLDDISTRIAVSDAKDIVTVQINRCIAEIFREHDYSADWFVSFEKDEAGQVCALNCNMARINALSSEILSRTVDSTDNKTLKVSIPAGNLTGISLFMGRGPEIPMKILMLTSSKVEFSNSLVGAGINQTKHRINLNVIVDVDILLPWGTESTQVTTEVMIADTVVVGDVPQTYFNVERQE